MPLSEDPKVVQTSKDLASIMKSTFKTPPGFRPAHARGIILEGSFTPSPLAASLSSAKHFKDPSTSITVRFSSSTGIPQLPDTDPSANPRGCAIRFHLGNDERGRRVHTDIVTHSTPFFPTRTGEEFLEFFRAIASSGSDAEHPTPVEQFLGSHPKAVAFVQAPKPSPLSFATAGYFGVNAFKFVNDEGKETYVRYRITPVLGARSLDETTLKGKSPSYLYDEVKERVGEGPIEFKLLAQIADEGDVTDDATIHWPEDRPIRELGEVKLEKVIPEAKNEEEQKQMIFDPVPRIKGVEPSADPLLDVRASLYLISGKERRAA